MSKSTKIQTIVVILVTLFIVVLPMWIFAFAKPPFEIVLAWVLTLAAGACATVIILDVVSRDD